jgi:hypothetical protein
MSTLRCASVMLCLVQGVVPPQVMTLVLRCDCIACTCVLTAAALSPPPHLPPSLLPVPCASMG